MKTKLTIEWESGFGNLSSIKTIEDKSDIKEYAKIFSEFLETVGFSEEKVRKYIKL